MSEEDFLDYGDVGESESDGGGAPASQEADQIDLYADLTGASEVSENQVCHNCVAFGEECPVWFVAGLAPLSHDDWWMGGAKCGDLCSLTALCCVCTGWCAPTPVPIRYAV
jgi:hypothetical protein